MEETKIKLCACRKALTTDEMGHLEDLGVDISDANMFYDLTTMHTTGRSKLLFKEGDEMFIKVDGQWRLNGCDVCMPAYSFEDIVRKHLPDRIDLDDGNEWYLTLEPWHNDHHDREDHDCEKLRISYKDSFGDFADHTVFESEDWVQAAYDLLVWTLENGHKRTECDWFA